MKKALFTALAATALLAACTSKAPANTPVDDTTDTVPEATVMVTATPTSSSSAMMMKESNAMMVDGKYVFKLAAQNKSGQDGTATLEEVGGKVKVTLDLTSPVTSPEPAHVHVGKCPSPGAVKYPLTNVVSGKSVTTLDTTLAAMMKLGDISINVHKSAEDLKTYMSCGDLDFKAAAGDTAPSASAKASTKPAGSAN
jgi:hypothetical protein